MDKWQLNELADIDDYSNNITQLNQILAEIRNLLQDKSLFNKHDYFKNLFGKIEQFQLEVSKLYALGMLTESVDNKNQKATLIKTKAINIITKYEDLTRDYFHWLKGLPSIYGEGLNDINAKSLFVSIPDLNYLFTRMREEAKHSLDTFPEEIVSKKDLTGTQSLLEIRSEIETKQRYKYLNPKTKKYQIYNTSSELLTKIHSSVADVRKNAYKALLSEFNKNAKLYFNIYESIIKNWNFESQWRKYDSPISMRNVANNIPDQVVSIILDTVTENKAIFNRFFKLKAKILGMEKLTRFDIYSHIDKYQVDEHIEYNQAKNIVLKVLESFDSEFYLNGKSIIDSHNIDSHPNKSKQSGAYCATITPQIAPYVLLNYTNRNRDVLVLAHELGHGIHSIFANKHSILAQDAPLTLAETASTLSEMLVFDYLYKNTVSKQEKIALLLDKISDSYATIMRQAYFVKFEIEAHQVVPKGILLEDFNQLYLQNLRDQFSDVVEIPEIFKIEWAYIPHIVNSPFYCYSYTFGDLFSFSLYNDYLNNKDQFKTKIKNILRAGGSQNPTQLLLENGYDINRKEFWQNSFRLIEQWINELEELINS